MNPIKEASERSERWRLFINTIFFVIGFSAVFALLGVLLQTVLPHAQGFQVWISRIAGVAVIFFGIFMLDLIPIPALLQEHRIKDSRFKPGYFTSFLFGAAFAVGWTPCVSAALGAILALAVSQPSASFVLLMAYSLGIGLPFIIASLFIDKFSRGAARFANVVFRVRYVFAAIMILLGVLIFTQRLSDIANLPFFVNLLASLGLGSSIGSGISALSVFSVGIAFVAGLFSFGSPCILPLLPTFLSYLASLSLHHENK